MCSGMQWHLSKCACLQVETRAACMLIHVLHMHIHVHMNMNMNMNMNMIMRI